MRNKINRKTYEKEKLSDLNQKRKDKKYKEIELRDNNKRNKIEFEKICIMARNFAYTSAKLDFDTKIKIKQNTKRINNTVPFPKLILHNGFFILPGLSNFLWLFLRKNFNYIGDYYAIRKSKPAECLKYGLEEWVDPLKFKLPPCTDIHFSGYFLSNLQNLNKENIEKLQNHPVLKSFSFLVFNEELFNSNDLNFIKYITDKISTSSTKQLAQEIANRTKKDFEKENPFLHDLIDFLAPEQSGYEASQVSLKTLKKEEINSKTKSRTNSNDDSYINSYILKKAKSELYFDKFLKALVLFYSKHVFDLTDVEIALTYDNIFNTTIYQNQNNRILKNKITNKIPYKEINQSSAIFLILSSRSPRLFYEISCRCFSGEQ